MAFWISRGLASVLFQVEARDAQPQPELRWS